jgi:dTDP-4-amino-4,6-dideoxygalactose transaminase
MADMLTLPHEVVGASSGTSALVGAILATAGRPNDDRPYALIPAFTFVATALAAEQCGYRPYLADVSPIDWLLDPEKVNRHRQLEQIGLVVPVGTFGKGVLQEPWLAFREKTGIPVVIWSGKLRDADGSSRRFPRRYSRRTQPARDQELGCR